jgi:DNA-binding IscR family transcriptional regulator
MRRLPADAEFLLDRLLMLLPAGRGTPVQAGDLALRMGISERMVRQLVDALIDRGHLVGSSTGSAGRGAGYFLVRDEEDLRVGTAHLISRARSLFSRVSRLRASAAEQFAAADGRPQQAVLDLFDIEPRERAEEGTPT